ncbi:SIMPL domain-containing protein [Streptomyces sp. NPDC051940]|uniref:SIMPL domain-containing protein n=1 Tax=Streptomyces sp. NPDC051940 TaxID=3155675 RepID=UPI003419AE2C
MRRIAAVTLLSASVLAVTATVPALAQSRLPEPATVSVTGSGSATKAPDLAVLSAGVEADGRTAKEAMAAQSKAAKAMLDAVHKEGIEDRDIKTDGLSLGPRYDYNNGSATLVGYQAGQTFTIKVRDIAKTGSVVSAVTAATGDAGRINGVGFDVSDRQALEAEAREAAFGEARAKAEQYAKQSGGTLGRLVSVSEYGGTPVPYQMPMMAAAEVAAGGPAPVAPGEVKGELSVSVVYELS